VTTGGRVGTLTITRMIDPRRPTSPAVVSLATRAFRPAGPPSALSSGLFHGDAELAAVAMGRLRLGRWGDPQYPAPIRSRGAAVMNVQRALLYLGHPLPSFGADGRYGNETYRAVFAYKRARGILTTSGYLDGIVGPKTIARLDAELPQNPLPSCPAGLPPMTASTTQRATAAGLAIPGITCDITPPQPCSRPATSVQPTTVTIGGIDFSFAVGVLQFNPTQRGEVAVDGNRVIVSMHREDAANRCAVNAWAYTADVSDPPGWQYGFIQNVLTARRTAAYANGRVLRSEVAQPRLDGLPGNHLPFFAPFAVQTSGGTKLACLQDSPRQAFALRLRGASITAICVHDRYRVFLAARQHATAPLITLVMKEIEICRGFRPADPQNPAGTWLKFGRQEELLTRVRPAPLPAPIVSPPLANNATTVVEDAGSCDPTECKERNDLCAIGCCPILVSGPCCTVI
jgi:hypothetical protein